MIDFNDKEVMEKIQKEMEEMQNVSPISDDDLDGVSGP